MINKERISSFMIIVCMFCAGMYLVPLRIMQVDLAFIPGNLGDSRLNNYFLEHGYRWLTGQVASFWNAPFFYPADQVMTFSDNHLGTLPIYFVFRFLHFDRETSYQIWFIVIFALNFISAAWVLKKLSINTLGVAVGAFIFSFSLPVIARLGHSQLLPRFMIPLAFFFALQYFEKPSLKSLAILCLSIVIQFYCTIYMGYFLILGLFSFLLSFVLFNPGRAILLEIFWGSAREFILRTFIIVISIVGLLPLMVPYYQRSLVSGVNSWGTVSSMLPRIQSYFYPAGGSILWNWLSPIGKRLPMGWEHQIFIGGLPWLAFLSMPLLYIRKGKEPLIKRGMIIFFALLTLMILTLYWNGFSLYKLMMLLPGTAAIRAMTRIMLMNSFLFAILTGTVITQLGRQIKDSIRYRYKVLLVLFILMTTAVDQYALIPESRRYSKSDAQSRSHSVEQLVLAKKPDTKIFAYMPKKSSDPPYAIHLDAMLAAQDLNMATVNGYSGNVPFNYNDFYEHYGKCDSLFKWIFGSNYGHTVSKDLFEQILIVGRDTCKGSRHSYTVMDHPLPEGDFKAKIDFHSETIAAKGGKVKLAVNLTNSGSATWGSLNANKGSKYAISLSYRWLSSDHTSIGGFDSRIPLPYDLSPGESIAFEPEIQLPAKQGTYFLEFDVVQEWVAWFHDKGSPTAMLKVIVE